MKIKILHAPNYLGLEEQLNAFNDKYTVKATQTHFKPIVHTDGTGEMECIAVVYYI